MLKHLSLRSTPMYKDADHAGVLKCEFPFPRYTSSLLKKTELFTFINTYMKRLDEALTATRLENNPLFARGEVSCHYSAKYVNVDV